MKRSGPLVRRKPLPRGTVKAPRWKGRKSATWHRSRVWVEGRASGLCEARTPDCTGRGAHAHHMRMRSQGGSDGTENLLWVCPPCHAWIHAHPAESYRLGLLVRGGHDG